MNWHRLNIREVYALLAVNAQCLSASVAKERLLQCGTNVLQGGKKKTIAVILLAQFKDVMILNLLADAVISGIIGGLSDT
ncbi:MAG: cation-transporting P-type ATPase [Ferruginibacter sp.]